MNRRQILQLLIGLLFMLAAPTYFALQPWAVINLAGAWRIAALAPVVVAVSLLVLCAYLFAHQSNLWPVPFLVFAPFGTFYLVVILGASGSIWVLLEEILRFAAVFRPSWEPPVYH